MSSTPPPARRRPPVPLTLLKLIGAIGLAGVLVAVLLLPVVGSAGAVANDAANKFLDTPCDVTNWSIPQPTQILARDGKTVIARLFNQNRQDIPLSAVPMSVREALISTEDRRFYSHHGVDLRGLIRAAVNNTGSSDTQGGSTLTMQYVKQLRFYQAGTDAERQAAIAVDLHRKIQDAQCAIQIEQRLSKDEILQDYLNIAFFGENSYGLQTAAQTYFGVPAAKLTVPQGAVLVGLLQSPSAYDPFQHPQAAIDRRNQVLQNMADTGAITAEQAAQFQKQPVQLATTKPPAVPEGCAYANPAIPNAGFFCDYAVKWLADNAGVSEQKLQNGGYTVVTTLDAPLQTYGQNAIFNSGLSATSPVSLVMPSVDPPTGEVITMISSKHYGEDEKNGETVNPLFTAAYAGAGSTYKYFTALAAMELGATPDFTLTTGNDYTVKNCPLDPNDPKAKPYEVHNAGTYSATLPLRLALPESVNTYFVGLEDQFFGCNLGPIVQMGLDLGMNAWKLTQNAAVSQESVADAVTQQHQPGFTLGFDRTSALEMSGAYAAIANNGTFCPPHPILSVTDGSGNKVGFKQPQCKQVIDPQIAHELVNIMTADTTSSYATAGRWFKDWYAQGGSQVASKTGTDNDRNQTEQGGNSALWFIGVTPHLSAAAALVNYADPKATINSADLPPNAPRASGDVFGAYASTFWQAAYGPALLQQNWTWPQPTDVPGGVSVPSVVGLTSDAASALLKQAGFAPRLAPIQCGSALTAGKVAYDAPQFAAPGAQVTLCLSNGIAPNSAVYAQPPPGRSTSRGNR